MGCGWRAMDIDFSKVNAIEAVNGGTVNKTGSPEGQYSSIPFWEDRLNAGVRITAIGGSDNHNPTSPPNEASSVGVPTTVVHASELSQPAVLEGIRKGHVFVDVWGSPAGLLEVEAEANGQHAEMGDVLIARNRTRVGLSVHIAGVPPDSTLTWAGDGVKLLVPVVPAAVEGGDARYSVELIVDGHPHWLRADVRSADGKLLLLGNPIYLRGP